jgi:hypothetical protein
MRQVSRLRGGLEGTLDDLTYRAVAALQDDIDRLWRYLEHTGNAERARREATEWRRRTDDLRRELDAHFLKLSQQTSQYVNVVSVIGYAGYFAVWNFTRSMLTPAETSLVALLGLVSLGLFCLWEIFVIQYRLHSLGRMGALMRDTIAPDLFEERRQEIIANEAKVTRAMTPIWQVVLAICIVAMLAGGVIMARRFYLSLP